MGKWDADMELKSEPGREPQRTPPHEPSKPGEPIHKPGEPREPHKKPGPEEEPEQVVHAMTEEQFERLLLAVRSPVIDPRVEARKKHMKEHNQRMQADDREMKRRLAKGCNHMQAPGSVLTGCSLVAWGNQSDGKRRGCCQRCGTIFSPVRSECLSQEIWQAYTQMVQTPTHPAGNMNTIFQSA